MNKVKRMSGLIQAEDSVQDPGPVTSYKLSPEELAKYGPVNTKKCSVCGKDKPMLQFRIHGDNRSLYGMKSLGDTCKECRRKRRGGAM